MKRKFETSNPALKKLLFIITLAVLAGISSALTAAFYFNIVPFSKRSWLIFILAILIFIASYSYIFSNFNQKLKAAHFRTSFLISLVICITVGYSLISTIHTGFYPKLNWSFRTGPDQGQTSPYAVISTWGNSRNTIAIHADSPGNLSGKSDFDSIVSADLPWRIRAAGGGIRFMVVQHESLLYDADTGQIYAGGDGVQVKFDISTGNGDEKTTIGQSSLFIQKNPADRTWKTIDLVIPQKSTQLFIEAIPGSNNYRDRVWISDIAYETTPSAMWLSSLILFLAFYLLMGVLVSSILILQKLGFININWPNALNQWKDSLSILKSLLKTKQPIPFNTLSRKIFTANGSALLTLIAFSLFCLIVIYIKAHTHTAPPTWDDAWYLTNSEILYKAITGSDTASNFYYQINKEDNFYLLKLFSHIMGRSDARAPFLLLEPIPFYILFNSIREGLIATYLSLVALFIFFFYKLTLKLSADPWTATLAVIITCTMPLTYGLATWFLVEFSLLLCTTIWIYYQVQSNHFTDKIHLITLGIILGIGMLIKVSFPLYILGVVGWGGIQALIKQRSVSKKALVFGNGLLIGLISALTMAPWYLENYKKVISFGVSSGIGAISKDYSMGNPFDLRTLVNYWIVVINHVVSSYYFWIMVVFLIAALVMLIIQKNQTSISKITPALSHGLQISIAWFMVPFIIFSFGTNKDYRYLLPALPGLGFIIAHLITSTLRTPVVRKIGFPALLIFPCFLFCYILLPLTSTSRWVVGPFIVVAPELGYAERPTHQIWPFKKILTSIEEDVHTNGGLAETSSTRIGFVPNHRFFNINTFMYYTQHLDLPFQYRSFPPANKEGWDEQIKRLLDQEYLIVKTGDQGARQNDQILSALLNGTLPYSEFSRFALPDGSQCIIFKKNE